MTKLHSTLLAATQNNPEAPAIDSGKSGVMSYRELINTALELTRRLGPARIVGILGNRKQETYAAVIACFLSGRTFVPLNPAFPLERLQRIANLAGVESLLFEEAHSITADELGISKLNATAAFNEMAGLHRLEASLASTSAPDPTATAYQLFTSGSTGEPKGVPISYASLSAYAEAVAHRIAFPPKPRCSQLFDLSFDLAMHDIFITLSKGGTLVPASNMNLLMPHAYIEKRKIDVWFSVPTLAVAAIRGLGSTTCSHRLKLALFCGEPLPMDYVKSFRAFMTDQSDIYNLYGPTEATIAFTAHEVTGTDDKLAIAPIGTAFGNNRLGLLIGDRVIEHFDEGSEGELLLGGPQVFDGYHPPNHSNCFVDGPSAKYYRSGDRARFKNGLFHHLGRIDDQVKVRGNRIELGEIEATFRNLSELDNVAAVVVGESENARICLAYEGEISDESISAATKHLPSYMVPASYMRLKSLPVNANGKIDRKALAGYAWPEN